MNRKYFLQFCIVFLFFQARYLAQLSGVYTINNTISASVTNYTSFSAFASALNSSGISGPVTVNVLTNGTFISQVDFTQPAGVSSTNTITINGNGATLTFGASSSASPFTMRLSGADYMTINNLNLVGTGTSYAHACHLWSGANNNTFNNCTFTSPIVGTGTGLCPFSISGSGTAAASAGNSGNNNVVNSCTMTGGYYSTVFYGSSSAPFNTNNTLINSTIRDFYTYGCYNLYCKGTTFKGNVIERVNRTTVTTTYAIYLSTGSTANEVVDGNHVRNLFGGINGSTSTAYCIYVTADATLNNENIVKNNLISDIKSNGTIYAMYLSGAAFVNAYHNTISLDDISATAGTTYGIYGTGPSEKIKNNIITIGRGGAGVKRGIFLTNAATNLECDFNDVYISSTSGTNNPWYLNSGYTLANWQIAHPAYDQGSKDIDPLYTNPFLMDYVPTSTVINNMCPFVGVTADITGFIRSTAAPDPGAYEFYTIPCVGSAPANFVVTPPGVLCPNSNIHLGLANTFTNTGYNVQWQISTQSVLGPYTAISGATLPVYNTSTLTNTTYYNALISCINGGNTVTANAGTVQIALPVIDNVPYQEGFEGIVKTGDLPNCSWLSSSPYTATTTYTNNYVNNRFPHTGTNFAAFSKTPTGTNYFYSIGINLYSGITYSASVWYVNETVNFTDWTDFSILIGTSQTPGGLIPVASTPGGAYSYSALSNTFTVPNTGVYYVAIRATSSSGSSPFLSWDDLSVTIPCDINAPPLLVNSSGQSVCSGQPVFFNASGAATYTWSTGEQSAQISVTPSISTTYTLVATNALSGCSATFTQFISVYPSPPVSLFASNPSICIGDSTSLVAQGANTYNWSIGSVGSSVFVKPEATSSFSVIGINQYGCSTMQSIIVTVNPLPPVSITASSTLACKGDNITLVGNGALIYKWTSNPSVAQYGNPVNVIEQGSVVYTVTGTDMNGCSNISTIILSIEECTGIKQITNQAQGIKVYPNPSSGRLFIESKRSPFTKLEIFDLNGRKMYSSLVSGNRSEISISSLAKGVYNLKVKSVETVKYIKVVKTN